MHAKEYLPVNATMPDECGKSLQIALADTVRGVALMVFGTGARDKMLLAEISVTSSITELMQAEDTTKKELAAIVVKVRIAQKNRNKTGIKDLLQRSLQLRTVLATIGAKRMNMQKQLETLRQSQLNQNMLQSMKHTSDALQTMGMKISDADNIMLDFEDTASESNSLSKSMSMSLTDSDVTEQDLYDELDLILADEDIEGGFLRQPAHKLPPVPDNLRPLPDKLPRLPDKLPPLQEEEDIACAAQTEHRPHPEEKQELGAEKQEDAVHVGAKQVVAKQQEEPHMEAKDETKQEEPLQQETDANAVQ